MPRKCWPCPLPWVGRVLGVPVSPPAIPPHLSRRLSSTAGVTYGTRSHLPGRSGLLCRFGSGSQTPSLGMRLCPWMAMAGTHRPHHPGGGCGVPQPPLPLPFPPLGLGFPNQVKGLISIFRTEDSASLSLRLPAKSHHLSPSPSPSPSHPEPLIKPRSCTIDPSPWAGVVSAAQTLDPPPKSRLLAVSHRRSLGFWQAQPFSGPSSNWGGFLLFFFFFFSPGHQLKKQSGLNLPAMPSFA